MTITITLLLCLGLILGLRTPVLAWTLPKPILRAQPDSVVSKQTNVTFLCEGTTGANQYSLYKSGSSYSWPKQIPLKPENKAEFSISKVEPHHAGLYRCYYHTKDRSSEASEILELVVTGVYSKPRLSAQPSPVVTTGENVTIQCVSWQLYHSLILTKEGPQKLSWTQDSQHNPYIRESQALFSVGPVTSSQRWTFRCYSYEKRKRQVWSEPSDPLELLISGNLQKPTIESETGSVVASGSPVTIWCQGTLDAELYVLHKEGSQKPWGTQTPEEPGKKAKFSIPSVKKQHGGQYRCYCYSSAGWSERSDTLDLVVTGIYYNKPSLTALPSPVVTSGGNVTLQCVSMVGYEKFTLTKEDEKCLTSLDSQYMYLTGHSQALFSMENLTANHTGTFRCYGYYKVTPQLWSVPSDPLEIYISDPIGTSSPPPSRPMSTTELEMHVKILIGVSLAFLLLLFTLIFLLLLRKHEGKFRMSGPKKTVLHPPRGTAELVTRDRGTQKRANPATATHEGRIYASVEDMQSEDGVDLDSWRPPVEDPQGETYAQVKPSRLRRDGAILPSVMSREFLDTKDGETEDDREMDSQAAKSEDPQDRTYVQICRRTLRLGRASHHPYQAGEDPKQPTVYAALKATGPGLVFKNKK